MKMTSRLVVAICLSLAAVVAACDPGTAGPPTEPSDPTKTGYEPPGGNADITPNAGGSIDQLCSYVCMRFANACQNLADPTCASQCAASVTGLPMCEAVFRSFLQCLATAPLNCSNGGLDPNTCQQQSIAVSNCQSGISTGTAGSSGGSGTKL
jgi:hypothetical protein